MAVVGHRTHRAILYPIAARPDGKVLINWLAYTRIPAGSPPLEAWDTAAEPGLAAEAFRGWTYPWLDIHGLFARTERVMQLPNVDRDPDPALELRPRHADRRRRASDAAGRRAGGVAGGGRRPGAGGELCSRPAIRSRRSRAIRTSASRR